MKNTALAALTALTLGLMSSSLLADNTDANNTQSERKGVVEVTHLNAEKAQKFNESKALTRAMRAELSEQNRLMIDAMMNDVALSD